MCTMNIEVQRKLSELFAKAEQGDVQAQLKIAARYEYGNGVEQSYEEAVKWYRLAAEKKNPDAQFKLGYCYEQGKGVEPSNEAAIWWYRRAGEQGDAIARERARLLLNASNFKELENNFIEFDEELWRQLHGTF